MIEPYGVVAVQSIIRNVFNKNSRERTIKEVINRNLSIINYTAARHGGPKLFVLPEFSITGSARNRTPDEWAEIALQIPGPETKLLGEAARDLNVYLAGANFEYDPEWPGRYWNTAFIIDPAGEVILRYRKLNEGNLIGILNDTTPGDVYSAYVKRYGRDALFPVVDTPIGRLAACVCYDINFPEVTRALTMRGAELIIHPTGEPYGQHREGWEMAKRTRAYENMAYLVTCNHGEWMAAIDEERWADSGGLLFQDGPKADFYPSFRSHGHSEIVNYDGRVLAEANGPGECVIQATIDIESLRERRASGQALNILTQLRTKMYAPGYAAVKAAPNDGFLDCPLENRSQGAALTKQTIEGLKEAGILADPDPTIQPWNLALVQTNIKMWSPGQDRDEVVQSNLNRSIELIEEATRRAGGKLLLFPEFWLQGFLYDVEPADWLRLAMRMDGPEIQTLQEAAAKHGVYLAGAVFESHEDWPGRWFNTAFIIDDTGKLIHKYRKVNCGNLPGVVCVTTPGDVYTEYVQRYGYDSIWPVARTPIGNIATDICFSVNFAETSRMLALHGAEVILHPTGEPHGAYRPVWQQARQARAYENQVYWASTNHGSVSNTRLPNWRSRGHSCVVDFGGTVIARIDSPGEAIASATIEINAVRRARLGLGSKLAHLRTQLWAEEYASFEMCPTDLWAETPMQHREEGPEKVRANVERFLRDGTYAAPTSMRELETAR